jgi:hypothetical protein
MLRHVKTSGATRVGLALVAAALCTVGTAQAQSTYVGASALADIARFSSAGFGDSPGGEAFGGAIRVGTGVTERWGIDLEFTRPGEIEQENSLYYALGRFETALVDLVPGLAPSTPPGGMPIDIGRIGASLPFPFSSTTTERYSTLTVMPYVRQSLGFRADIVYLGGLAFVRTTSRMNFGGGIRPLGGLTRFEQSSVTYGSAPAVGLDVRVSMTEHVRLVPGLRLLAIDESGRTGWITRPSVGLQWTF